MSQFRILATIAILSLTATTYAASVSGEITIQAISNNSGQTISSIKKPIEKIVVHTKTQTVSYMSPAGKDSITFSVRIKDGTIVSVNTIPRSTNQISLSIQKTFAKNISKIAVGKKTKNLKLSAVAGASLTTTAFENFIRK